MVKVVKICEDESSEAIEEAADLIDRGELVIYPTETVYGLGADATSDEAAYKIFEAKKRPFEKPISIAVDSLSMAYYAGKLSRLAEDLIQEFLPGPLTVIVEKRPVISDVLSAGTKKIGIRIPDHPVALGIIRRFGRPITTTSANISGESEPFGVNEAVNQLEKSISLAIDSGRSKSSGPSTVVDLTEGLRMVREGPLSESKIRSFLR